VYIGKTVADALKNVQAAASAVTFHDKKTPGYGVTGATDGVNLVYTLASVPDTNSEHIYLNGILLRPGADCDYTLAGQVITLTGNVIPNYLDNLVISYRTTAV
jgi:hypothetical protein